MHDILIVYIKLHNLVKYENYTVINDFYLLNQTVKEMV